jgi:hypothetical protein
MISDAGWESRCRTKFWLTRLQPSSTGRPSDGLSRHHVGRDSRNISLLLFSHPRYGYNRGDQLNPCVREAARKVLMDSPAFVAYPSTPSIVGSSIRAAVERANTRRGVRFSIWE